MWKTAILLKYLLCSSKAATNTSWVLVPQCEQSRVRRTARTINHHFKELYISRVSLSSTSDQSPHLCLLKKLLIKRWLLSLFQCNKRCWWGRLHVHCRPSLCHRYEETLAWGHDAEPTRPLGTQTVSINSGRSTAPPIKFISIWSQLSGFLPSCFNFLICVCLIWTSNVYKHLPLHVIKAMIRF